MVKELTQQEKHKKTQTIATQIKQIDEEILMLVKRREQLSKVKLTAMKEEQATCTHPNWEDGFIYGYCPDCLADDM